MKDVIVDLCADTDRAQQDFDRIRRFRIRRRFDSAPLVSAVCGAFFHAVEGLLVNDVVLQAEWTDVDVSRVGLQI